MDSAFLQFRKIGLATGVVLLCISPSRAQTSPITQGAVTVRLTRIATVPAADGTPQDIVPVPDGSGRQLVTTRSGDILVLNKGVLSSTPFLTTSSAGISLYTGGEGGLFGLALSPNYSTNGKFYTFDTEPFSTTGPAADFSHPELYPTTTTNPTNQIAIREWTVSSNPNVASTTSRVLMRIDHPQSNHQGGSLRFGPDGNLYIGLGDGGGSNDENGSATTTNDGHTNATGNGQDTNVVFGKILRINPNPSIGAGYTISSNGQYATPNSNMFGNGVGGLREIYMDGLRNPYRMSFDSSSGKLFIGNVGQGNIESVNSSATGANFGWPYFEGTRNNQSDTGRTAPAGFAYSTPIAEYTHGDGEAIVGGEVYHGSGIPALDGMYVFGDLGGAANNTIGRLFYCSAAGGPISELKYDLSGLAPSSNLYGFGTDPRGELDAFFANGDILQLSAVPEPAAGWMIGLVLPVLSQRWRRMS